MRLLDEWLSSSSSSLSSGGYSSTSSSSYVTPLQFDDVCPGFEQTHHEVIYVNYVNLACASNQELKLGIEHRNFQYMWLPNSGGNTISKIDIYKTKTGADLYKIYGKTGTPSWTIFDT